MFTAKGFIYEIHNFTECKFFLLWLRGFIRGADIVLLDEPTNNLDIKSTAILETTLAQYHGATLLVSHDNDFVKNVNMNKVIAL